jgi:hypothetical protein
VSRECVRCTFGTPHGLNGLLCSPCGDVVDRIILRAAEAGELTNEEIAASLNLPRTTVENRKSRAMRKTRRNDESHLQASILLAWGAHPRVRLARQNTGVGWFAKGEPARKTDPEAYPVKFGTPGQADITGIIAPNGLRLEIECKTERGRQSDEQKLWERLITRFGGVYVLARSLQDVDDALAALGIYR